MIPRCVAGAVSWQQGDPRWAAVDTDDPLTDEQVYNLAVDGRPGVGPRAYRDCATGIGETEAEAVADCKTLMATIDGDPAVDPEDTDDDEA
jgi:hypothetical protein